jgi:hypothetical protein
MAFGPVSTEYKLTYQRNVELAIQRMPGKFEKAFTYHADLKGETAQVLDLVGATTAIVNGARGGDTPNIEGSHEQTWVAPQQIEWGKVIEREDYIKALTDFQSAYVQSGALAVRRAREDIMAASLYGSRLTGKTGTTVTAYSNTNRVVAEDVGSTGVTGMNVKKILRAFHLLEDQFIDIEMEQIFLALNPTEIEQLYNDITYVNTDYRSKSVLEEKRVLSILGIDIIPTTILPNLDSDTHRAFLWCKSAMHWGDFMPIRTDVAQNPAKKYRPHPYIENWMGASRGQDEKVIEILNHFP